MLFVDDQSLLRMGFRMILEEVFCLSAADRSNREITDGLQLSEGR